jgi:adenylate kinase
MLQAEVDKNPDSAGFFDSAFKNTFASRSAGCVLAKIWSITATIALEADDEILVARLLDRGKTSGEPDDQKKEIVTKNTMKDSSFNGVL